MATRRILSGRHYFTMSLSYLLLSTFYLFIGGADGGYILLVKSLFIPLIFVLKNLLSRWQIDYFWREVEIRRRT